MMIEIEKAECFDMRKGLPFADNFTNIIISDLSLHYFTEQQTLEILKEIESHLYENADGRLKRFFNEGDIQKFFADLEKLYIHEEVIDRLGTKKYCGEGLLRSINNF